MTAAVVQTFRPLTGKQQEIIDRSVISTPHSSEAKPSWDLSAASPLNSNFGPAPSPLQTGSEWVLFKGAAQRQVGVKTQSNDHVLPVFSLVYFSRESSIVYERLAARGYKGISERWQPYASASFLP